MKRYGKGGNLEDFRRNSQEALEKKRVLFDQMREAQKKAAAVQPSPVTAAETAPPISQQFPSEDALIEVIKQIPFYPADTPEGDKRHLQEQITEPVRAFWRVRREKKSEAFLSWPYLSYNVSTIHAAIALGLENLHQNTAHESSSNAGASLRTLYYPWSKRTAGQLNALLVDRHWLYEMHRTYIKHQHAKGGAIDGLHSTMIRVKDLDKYVKEQEKWEFLHPSLLEITPQVPADGEASDVTHLLYRIRKYTDIDKLNAGKNASQSIKTPSMLYGVRVNDSIPKALHNIFTPIDCILIDVSRRSIQKLGKSWKNRLTEFLAVSRARFGYVPAFAITDDPYTYNFLFKDILAKHDAAGKGLSTKRPPAASQAGLLTLPGSLIYPSSVSSPQYETDERISAVGFGGTCVELGKDIQSLCAMAMQLEDHASHRILSSLKAMLRRCEGLPAGWQALDDFISEEGVTADKATVIMGNYQPTPILNKLFDPALPLFQSAGNQLRTLRQKMESLFASISEYTPMTALLKENVTNLLGRSSKTLVVMRDSDGMLPEFAEYVLMKDAEIAERVKKRLDNQMLQFMDTTALELLIEANTDTTRHYFNSYIGWLLLVNLPRAEILRIMALPRLPGHVVVIGSIELLEGIAVDASRLIDIPALKHIQPRLTHLASALKSEVQKRYQTGWVFSDDDQDLTTEMPSAHIIELTGNDPGAVIEIATNHHTIRARPGTSIIIYEPDTAGTPFQSVRADSINTGDEICVLDESFLDSSRELLDLRATAAEEIRAYHELVSKGILEIPGDSRREKAREIARRMGHPEDDLFLSRVYNWINVESYLQQDLSVVQPHAPQTFSLFCDFIEALGYPNEIARTYWIWAVVATRSRRLSAGIQFHEAYIRILVDPSSLNAHSARFMEGVRALRRIAEQHISTVTAVTKYDSSTKKHERIVA